MFWSGQNNLIFANAWTLIVTGYYWILTQLSVIFFVIEEELNGHPIGTQVSRVQLTSRMYTIVMTILSWTMRLTSNRVPRCVCTNWMAEHIVYRSMNTRKIERFISSDCFWKAWLSLQSDSIIIYDVGKYRHLPGCSSRPVVRGLRVHLLYVHFQCCWPLQCCGVCFPGLPSLDELNSHCTLLFWHGILMGLSCITPWSSDISYARLYYSDLVWMKTAY